MEAVNKKPEFISPRKVLVEIGLEAGDTVVDYGSGSGHWAIEAARIVAPKGTVYALDDNIEILNALKSKAGVLGVKNIEIEEINLEKRKSSLDIDADLIIIANELHLIHDKQKFIKNTSELLGKSGQVLIVDWSREKSLFGPPQKVRLVEEDVITFCEGNDLNFICTVKAGDHHFGLLFDKGGEHEKRNK